jgi:hypothetical protein
VALALAFTKGQSGITLNPMARASWTSRVTSASPAPVPRKLSGTPVWSAITSVGVVMDKVSSASSPPCRMT